MHTKKILASILSLIIILTSGLAVAHAQTERDNDDPTERTQDIGIDLPNPLKHGDSIPELLRTIIDNIILPIGGILAVLAFIYSGFLYVMAQGKPAEIERANRALLYSAIGTAILLGAWVISAVIETTINQIRQG